jgi:hypothetical protein
MLRAAPVARCLLVLLAAWIASPAAALTIYDLAADWSDASNPNGVWSYDGSPGTPIATHVADWDPGSSAFLAAQPAWAAAALPSAGHVPMWLKSVGSGVAGVDLPAGTVGMHGSESAAAGVTWTSPGDGTVDVSGATWQFIKAGVHASRSMTWKILLNGSLLTSGVISGADAFTSAAPFDFSAGSGGAGALGGIAVATGDVITLQFEKLSLSATFAAAELAIAFDAPEPAGLALVGAGLIALAARRAGARRAR